MWRGLSISHDENRSAQLPFASEKGGMDYLNVGGLQVGECKAVPPQLLPRIGSFCEGKREIWTRFEFTQFRTGRDQFSWPVRRWRDCCEGITPRITVIGALLSDRVSGGCQ